MNVLELLEEMGFHPKKVGSTNGGEYHSPCPDPQCGGENRFCTWPNEGADGRYWCRRCLKNGDAIQFCRDFLGMDFPSACTKVGRKPAKSDQRNIIRPKHKFIPKQLAVPLVQWGQRGFDFIQKSHHHLLKCPQLINQGKDRGLLLQDIVDNQLGWNPAIIFEPRKLWGLLDNSDKKGSGLLCLPKGIVIPSFRAGSPIRIKIRRDDWKLEDEYPKYHIVAGGMTCPSLYGYHGKSLVIVEAEFDAILVQRYAKDICCCIALGGAGNRPDVLIDELLRDASIILFALDFDEAGKEAYQFWQSTYPHIRPWPVPKGKSPGDAYLLRVDLRHWIESGLKQKQLL